MTNRGDFTPRGHFVDAALAGEGGRYCTPPNEPHCTDCSGYVRRCWRQATGHDFPGDSHAQFNLGRVVSGSLQPGDLLFFDAAGGREVREGNRASHVGIYVGNGQMVNALNAGAGVVRGPVDTDYWRPIRIGARRLFDADGYILPGLVGALPDPPAGSDDPDPASGTTPPARPPRRERGQEHERDRGRIRQRILDGLRRRRVWR